VGASITRPGTLPRMQALKKGARDGLMIVIGLIPIFLVAGFLECFITRFYKMPAVVNWGIIILSLGFMIWYFVIYPIILNRKYNFNVDDYKKIKL
jgi:membrane protein YdbS with pleckstrin-like domain